MEQLQLQQILQKLDIVIEQQKSLSEQLTSMSEQLTSMSEQLTSMSEQLTSTREQLTSMSSAISVITTFQLEDFQISAGEETTRSQQKRFRTKLIRAYGAKLSDEKKLRCMLLNTPLPSNDVIAVHLFRWRWKDKCHRLSFDDIDDTRNGLLLYKPIEWAFDAGRICFWKDEDGSLRLKLLDPSLRSVNIVNKARALQGTYFVEPVGSVVLGKTFGDIEGYPLVITGLHQPYMRCLWFQAFQARKRAILKGWIRSDEWELSEYYTEGVDRLRKVRDWMVNADL